MSETKRSLIARAGTFWKFIRQQRAALPAIERSVQQPDASAPILLTGAETDWTRSGVSVQSGQRFRIEAKGHHWLSKPLGLVAESHATLFWRIAQGPARKITSNDAVYPADASGEIELLTKGLSEFADESGELLTGKRQAQGPGVSVRVALSENHATQPITPAGWHYLWQIGEGRLYSEAQGQLTVSTDRDVGILRKEIDLPITQDTRLSWDWMIENLPSKLPEDLAFTHDYLSIAVEFENGRDLTYMWSAGLDEGHIFRCPLDWWCDWETHWVLHSGEQKLGQWLSESRLIAADYREALGEPVPQRVVRVWLIANSIFQRNAARAHFKNIMVS